MEIYLKDNGVSLEQWLWKAACIIRGDVDPSRYKDYILPLIFLKRLSDVYDDELDKLAVNFGTREEAEKVVEEDHGMVRFYLPPQTRWAEIAKTRAGIGEKITDIMRTIARENPKLQGVIDVQDFNAAISGQRIVPDEKLVKFIDVMGQKLLGLDDVPTDIIGHAYEYLIRQFAQDAGRSAGEFFTPPPVAWLIARLLDPAPGKEVYDPCCGSAGLLIKCQLYIREKYGESSIVLCKGQEINPATFAMAKMNVIIHDMEADIRLGDTLLHPDFSYENRTLSQFDYVAANVMWNQPYDESTYVNDVFGRFGFGIPPNSSADWGWIQHMYSSLKSSRRMAVVLDTGAVSRGSGSTGANRERDIRKAFVDNDLVESVILLPENMFYNTSAPGCIVVCNKAKKHPGEIILINASKLFNKGRPKNEMSDEQVCQVAGLYHSWDSVPYLSTVITNEKAKENDFNLSPSRYIAQEELEKVLDLPEVLSTLALAEEEDHKARNDLNSVISELGLLKD